MDSKEKLVDRFKELLKKDDFDQYRPQIVEVIDAFHLLVEEDKKAKLAAFVADGDKPEFFEMPVDEHDKVFEELNSRYAAIVREKLQQKKRSEEKNFEMKSGLVQELKEVIENQDVISEAFKSFNSITDRWKQVGNVPSHLYKDLQADYRKAVEDFYYNINIYKELQINDLKKNFEKKEDLIARMAKLLEEKSIKDMELMHKAYLAEWDEIGPTFKEKWEEVKERFYGISHQISDKVKGHYKGIREVQKENLAKKQELVVKMAELVEQKAENVKAWNAITDKIKELQAEWKTVGFAPKNQNEKVWQEFKVLGNVFFEKKSEFYKDVKSAQGAVKDKKQEIIAKAKELAGVDTSNESIEWKQLTNKVLNLQNQWKSAGVAARHDEQKLWKEFRKQCDAFFAAKDSFFKGKEGRQKDNLKLKKDLVAELKKWEPLESKEESIKHLEEITKKWSAMGFVPNKDKEKISKDFAKAIDGAYAKLNVSKDEQVALAFSGKIKQLLNDKNPEEALKAERKRLGAKKGKLKEEKLQLENNMAFFANASSDNPLLKDSKNKIDNIGKWLEDLDAKTKMINIELNKLAKAADKTEE